MDADSVRASLLIIQLNLKVDKLPAAKKLFARLVRMRPEYMALFIEPARQIFPHNQDRQYQEFLQQQYQQQSSNRIAMALLEHYARNDDIEKARQFLSDILHQSPSFEAFEFALRFKEVYAAIGYHPNESNLINEQEWKDLEKLACHEKVVAIGETGLDYYRKRSPSDDLNGFQHKKFGKTLATNRDNLWQGKQITFI